MKILFQQKKERKENNESGNHKKLTLTREEKEIISCFYDILDDDKDLDITEAWEIFTAVRDYDNDRAGDYNYYIIVTD